MEEKKEKQAGLEFPSQATPAATPRESAPLKVNKPVNVLKAMLNAPTVQEQFKNALGNNKDMFVASLVDLYTGDPMLQKCAPQKVISEALRAATMKLPLNKALGFSYIVVYNNSVKNADGTWSRVPTPTFIPGYKGYIQLAMRTGQYKTINADVVYEGELTSIDKLSGEIDFGGERKSDKIVGYFCYFRLVNGFAKTLFMSVDDMATYAKRYSPSVGRATTVEQLKQMAQETAASKRVGWEGNFTDMAIKTVIRRLLSKYGYLSVEMQNALAADIIASGETRDELVYDKANADTVDFEDASFEEVDPA